MNTVLKHHPNLSECSYLPPVPLHILSRDGAIIGTDGSIWRLCGTSERGVKYRINWAQLDDVGTYPLLKLSKRA